MTDLPVVICGGGIIGCSTAYYLAKRGVASIILEQSGVASGASGKAGGFLAANWNDGGVGKLAKKSFAMHAELEAELGRPIDYRRLSTLSVKFSPGSSKPASCPKWVTGTASNVSVLGDEKTTAQVHPYKLTTAFLEKAQELVSCTVRLESVTGIKTVNSKVTGVKLQSGEVVPCHKVVFCMGPWTYKALDWLGLPTHLISGHRAHSIVVIPTNPIPPQALFTEMSEGSPEVYPRPDGTVYLCGVGDDVPLPDSTALVEPDKGKISCLLAAAANVSSHLTEPNASLIHSQACFLPTSALFGPIMGPVSSVPGAFIAAGHSCWGILNAPASGLLMSELILDGKCSFMDATCFQLQSEL